MNVELQALRNNSTWDLVPRPSNLNVVGSKWVFRTKCKSDGSINRYKAHLIAQGFTQVPRLDYSHTCSPVIKASIVYLRLAIVVHQNWGVTSTR